jgi:hypothetical protein
VPGAAPGVPAPRGGGAAWESAMRSFSMAVAALLVALPAVAQTDPVTGARPGHVPGVGDSLPRSDRASNIGPGTVQGIAPSLPQPAVGDAGGAHDYLQAAREALAGGRTGLAQESLEMAETRLLSRAQPSELIAPSGEPLVMLIRRARQALDSRQPAQALEMVDAALR